MSNAPISIDSEPTPFPEALEPTDTSTAEVHDDLAESIAAQLNSTVRAAPDETSLYYDASSMASLSPISAVSLSCPDCI